MLREFQYGLLGSCAIAVYEHGAISGRSGEAIAVRGDVFTKWLSLRGPYNETGWFGCPTNEEGETLAGARSQPFERGRIYAKLPTIAPPVAFYVPAVFVDAIDKRGGDPGIATKVQLRFTAGRRENPVTAEARCCSNPGGSTGASGICIGETDRMP